MTKQEHDDWIKALTDPEDLKRAHEDYLRRSAMYAQMRAALGVRQTVYWHPFSGRALGNWR